MAAFGHASDSRSTVRRARDHSGSAEKAAGGGLEGRFGALRGPQDAGVVLDQQFRGDQRCSGGVLGGATESFAGALGARSGERAVQHPGSGGVEGLVVVPDAASDLPLVDDPRSRSEHVGLVSDALQG